MTGILKIVKKFGLILSGHQRIRIFELCLLMIAGGFLETFSVSLILPFMNIIVNPQEAMKKWYVKMLCSFFNIQSSGTFLVVVSVMLALLYLFKNIYLMFEYNVQYRFVYGNMFAMQKKLLETFIHRPYEYFLKVNSGEIIRIITTDTNSAFTLLVTLLSMLTEVVVSGMLIAAIFIITPFITVCITVLLLVLLVFINAAVKPVLRKQGLNQQKAVAGMNKWLLQSVQGIKELKVMQKEDFFQDHYDKNGQIYVRSLRWGQTLGTAPRFIIEGVCMGAMFMITALLICRGIHLESIIPTLTAVAMAAVRLLPSVNRISIALTQVAYGEPMLDKVIENLQMIDDDNSLETGSIMSDGSDKGKVFGWEFAREIDFSDVSYHYPDMEKDVLSSASMRICKGESIGIAGASGSGKTTVVDIILGLLVPEEGCVFVDGIDINNSRESWLAQIGYIPQSIFMLDDTVRANVAFGEPVEKISDEKVWMALCEAALDDFVKNLPDGIDTEIGERGMRLSGGQRQRIGIARALYRSPQVLIFDEATSALDNETEAAIMDSIHSLHGHKTMIIIAHRLTTIEACDHIYRVENGKIVLER